MAPQYNTLLFYLKCIIMTDFFVGLIKSPCNILISIAKIYILIAISLPHVLTYQKHELSFPVGGKTARPKTGDWAWLWRYFQDFKFWGKKISPTFPYFLINNTLLYHFLANALAHNEKMTDNSVFCKALCPEIMSRLFPVSCFWSHSFVKTI